MALFPDVQSNARTELDKVIGPNRLPEVSDLDKMPHIRAVVMETIRWRPFVPFRVPHAVNTVDEYKGYHVPQGAIVIPVSLSSVYGHR